MSYDAGTIQPAKKISETEYIVDSFRGAPRSYRVTVGEVVTCTCPHFQQRLAGGGGICKHAEAVLSQREWINAAEKAKKLSDEQLLLCLAKHHADPVISGAIRAERQRRREQAAEPTVGQWQKVWGPTTESEAFA